MILRRWALAALVAAATCAGAGARADLVTGTYDFTGDPGNQATEPVGTVSGTGATFGPLTRGSGLTASAAVNSFSSSAFSTNATLTGDALQDYYEFIITPQAGFTLGFTNLAFSERRSGTGIRTIEVRASTDPTFATSTQIGVIGVPDDTLVRRQDVAVAGLTGLTSALTVRIYGYAAEAAAGTWRLGISGGADNPSSFPANLIATVNATPSAVPEPGSLALLGLGCLALATLTRRRRAG